jgi:carbon storage regulator
LEISELKERPMLVLSRKLNESIVINDNIVVTVLGVKGDRVRIGIDAPGEIPVHRQELFEKMQNQAVLMSVG